MANDYPPEFSIEDIKVKIQETFGNPNIGKTHQVDLKDGPRTYRVATIFEIINPATQALHHLVLQLDSYDKSKQGWRAKPEKKISIESKAPNEILALSEFLNAVLSEHYPETAGKFRLVTNDHYKLIENFVGLLPTLPEQRKLELIKQVLQSIERSNIEANDFLGAFQHVTPDTLKNIGIAAKFIQYKAAYSDLESLIRAADPVESKYQNHLKEHPWIFGSEYSEILDRRKWTRDDNLDFMLRRTVDNCLEIVEIKTPATMPLFNFDKNHDCYYASQKLSQVLGQTYSYIEEVERNRDSIMAKDKLDPLKIRARIIIGVDGNQGQQDALRTMNSHLHRIEIITFDQLLRVAQRTLNIFESQLTCDNEQPESDIDDDIPF